MQEKRPLNGSASGLLRCLASADHRTSPYDFWLLRDALPPAVCRAIAALPVAPPAAPTFDGRREANNTTRFYFSPSAQREHAVCREVVDAFRHPHVVATLAEMTGARLADARLRIEYCQDTEGFWLEPHVDIPVKRFTMLVYLSDDPALANCGTDVYDATPEHRLVASARYELSGGMIFIPGKDTWHGFAKRPIQGVRKSIIVNWVAPEWRAVEELA